VVHCAFLVLVILLLAPLAAHIPLAALAAILFHVAWNISDLHRFTHVVKTAPRADVGVLLLTFLLTVFSDLVVAVNVGVVLASLLFMRRMAKSVSIEENSETRIAADSGLGAAFVLPVDTVVYNIDGPFFFGAAEYLEKTLRRSQNRVRTVVIRMGRVPFMDTTGLSALDEIVADFQRIGTRVVLCEVRANVLEKLERARILARVGPSGVYRTLSEFLATHELDAGREI
jgi:sulfate permease, SulP family